MSKVSVGTTLKIVGSKHGHEFRTGENVSVLRIDAADRTLPFLCVNSSGKEWWVGPGEYEISEETLVVKGEYKAGDKVRVLKTGTHPFDVGDIVTIEHVDSGDRQPYRCGPQYSATWLRKEECELVDDSGIAEETPVADEKPLVVVSRAIKVGDKVRVKEGVYPKFSWGAVIEGEVGVVVALEEDGCSRVNFPNQNHWKALNKQMEILEEASESVVEPKADKPAKAKKLANNLYALVHKDHPKVILWTTQDRAEAREEKFALGGKAAGYMILKYQAVKEVR